METKDVMSLSNSQLVVQLINEIQDNLLNYLLPNAEFLAQRLLAVSDAEESRGVLADVYLVQSKPRNAIRVLLHTHSEMNRYRAAVACFRMKRYGVASKILMERNKSIYYILAWNNTQIYPTPANFWQESFDKLIPNGGYGLYLLGQIFEEKGLDGLALECYAKALRFNPALWIAYEKICRSGMKTLPPKKVFCEDESETKKAAPFNADDFMVDLRKCLDRNNQNLSGENEETKENLSRESSTPAEGSTEQSTESEDSYDQKQDSSEEQNDEDADNTDALNVETIHENEHQPPQLSDLIKLSKRTEAGSVLVEEPNHQSRNKPVVHKAIISKQATSIQLPLFTRQPKRRNQPRLSNEICHLLYQFGQCFYFQTTFNLKRAIQCYKNLPQAHQLTRWVQSALAYCYMGTANYKLAKQYFIVSMSLDPYYEGDLASYSLCLWHLKSVEEMYSLTMKLMKKFRMSSEVLIVFGNCFSLLEMPSKALSCFSRAFKIDETNPIICTAAGNDFIDRADLAQGIDLFQYALELDPRSYAALWGLGKLSYSEKQYMEAADYFKKAIRINKDNSVLYSSLGMAYEALGQHEKALKQYERAEKADPENVKTKILKAELLMQLNRQDEVLDEMIQLSKRIKDEPQIPIVIGQIYEKQGKPDVGYLYYIIAVDLIGDDPLRKKAVIDFLQNNGKVNIIDTF